MSTSSRRSAKRRASSLARSRTSPTRRSSRSASSAITSSDRRRDSASSMTPSRSAATCPRIAVSGVRSSCETDMRKLRESSSDSASRVAIWPNRAASRSTSLPPVARAARPCSGRRRPRPPRGERLERPHDPAREVDDERAGDGDPDPERDRELPHELEPAAAQRRVRLRRRRARRTESPRAATTCATPRYARAASRGGRTPAAVPPRSRRRRHGAARELRQRRRRGARRPARRAPRTPCPRRAGARGSSSETCPIRPAARRAARSRPTPPRSSEAACVRV